MLLRWEAVYVLGNKSITVTHELGWDVGHPFYML